MKGSEASAWDISGGNVHGSSECRVEQGSRAIVKSGRQESDTEEIAEEVEDKNRKQAN